MKEIVYSDHVAITSIQTITMVIPKNRKSAEILEHSANQFTESIEFIAAEECRKRFERYKNIQNIDKTIYWANVGKFLYTRVLQKIKAIYQVPAPESSEYIIDTTPMGQLIDEIEYAISELKKTY